MTRPIRQNDYVYYNIISNVCVSKQTDIYSIDKFW